MYNRSPAKAEAWVAKFGGRAAPTPKAAAAGQDIVFCCVGNDDDLRQVTLGPDGAIHGMAAAASSSITPLPVPMSRAICMPSSRRMGSALSTLQFQAARAGLRTASSP